MALSSLLSSFHLASLFPVFCHQATTTSNLRRVCSLKRVSYLANLASTTTSFEALRFHCITWPCNSGITHAGEQIYLCLQASYNLLWQLQLLPQNILLVILICLMDILLVSKGKCLITQLTQPIQYFFLVHLLHLQMLFQGSESRRPLPPKGCYRLPSACPLGSAVALPPSVFAPVG